MIGRELPCGHTTLLRRAATDAPGSLANRLRDRRFRQFEAFATRLGRPLRNVIPIVGDATALDHPDRSFDLAFSNSVIEHLFTWENQQRMADEVRRVARAYWVQTPNYWFPVEPHYLIPGWQWLPLGARERMLRGAREIRLLRRGELARLFPDASLLPERVGGLVKSWTATRAA